MARNTIFQLQHGRQPTKQKAPRSLEELLHPHTRPPPHISGSQASHMGSRLCATALRQLYLFQSARIPYCFLLLL